MARWGFLTNHARGLVLIARDPDIRLRDIAVLLGITERNAHTIVAALTEGGYVVKYREDGATGTRSGQSCPWAKSSGERTIGEVLALLVGAGTVRSG